jgi:molybdate transport system ATP-binding protein
MTLEVDVRARRGRFALGGRFEAHEGETLAILGPNGSGKSTLLEIVAGLVRPDAGRVVLDGVALDDVGAGLHVEPEERPIGVVFQDRLLFPHLSALENVAFPRVARGERRADASRLAGDLLSDFGVSDKAHVRPARLSGGEAQRVALARALAQRPRALLLDEPFSALDVEARGRLRESIARALGAVSGVRVLVTHDPVEALTLADRIVVLEAGRIVQSGTSEELRTAPRTAYAAEVAGVNLFRGRLEPVERGVGRVRTSDGEVIVAWPADLESTPIDDVIGILRPSDVSIHTTAPEGSARNILHGTVERVTIDGHRARVHARTAPPIIAEVTAGSVSRLGLVPGVDVWVSFKAVEIGIHVP